MTAMVRHDWRNALEEILTHAEGRTGDEPRVSLAKIVQVCREVLQGSETATPHGWQPIETWKGGEAFFWLVEKNDHSSSLYPRLYRGEFGAWWSGAKATHWMPIPDPPLPPQGEGKE